jgi:hypothetical protein
MQGIPQMQYGADPSTDQGIGAVNPLLLNNTLPEKLVL